MRSSVFSVERAIAGIGEWVSRFFYDGCLERDHLTDQRQGEDSVLDLLKRLYDLRVEYLRDSDSIPLGTVAMTMSECGQLDMTLSQAIRVLERMVDEGSRFANLERGL